MSLAPLQQAQSPVISAGVYTYIWDSISAGMAAQASVSVPQSGAGNIWAVFIGGSEVASIVGSNAFGPVYLGGGAQVTLVGTPTPGTAPGPAMLVGTLGLPSDIPPTAPASSSAVTLTSIQNATIPVSGDINANITNASLAVSGSVSVSSGTINATITNANIPVSGSVSALITNASIPVTGSVSAAITNATLNVGGTVAISSGSVNANITNASIAVTGSLNANITNATVNVGGTVAVSSGSVAISSGSVAISNSPTVNIAAGQVIEVLPGSQPLTVAGTVNASVVNATIDTSGSLVDISATGITALLGTIAAGSTVATVTTSPGTTVQTIVTAGTSTWVCPLGITSIEVQCWGGGGGGWESLGANSGGGGGGEYAVEAFLAVTPGKSYLYTVGAGGTFNGGQTNFVGDVKVVTANGGGASTSSAGGLGGTGSANSGHFNGGAGGAGYTGSPDYCGGGGSSAGTGAVGNIGLAATSGGIGGSQIAPTGGGPGGQGGASPTSGPGGGGGGLATGFPGQIVITYTVPPGYMPSYNSLILTSKTPPASVTFAGSTTGILLPTGQNGPQWVAALPAGNGDLGIVVTLGAVVAQPVYVYGSTGELVISAFPAGGNSVTEDSSPNGQGLAVMSGSVASVPSPFGLAFGQGLQLSTTAYLNAPVGATNAQGAATGTAFALDFIYSASAADVANGCTVLARGETNFSVYQWHINVVGGGYLQLTWFDSGGTSHQITSAAGAVVAGIPHQYEVDWSGTNLYLFMDGVAVGVTPLAMTTVRAATATGYMQIGALQSSGVLGEVRLSSVARNTAGFSPATGPFVTDPATGSLYHFASAVPTPDARTPTYTVLVGNPAAGANWSYTLLAPARLKYAVATFTASATVASRSLLLSVNTSRSFVPFLATTVAASGSGQCNAFPAAPLSTLAVGSAGWGTAPIPDQLLPAGTVVTTYVFSIQTGDQWSAIALSFDTP